MFRSSSATNNATPNTPNYLGFPKVTPGNFDASQFLPDISGLGFNNINFPGQNLLALAQLVGGLLGGGGLPSLPFAASSSTSNALMRASTPSPAAAPQTMVAAGLTTMNRVADAGVPTATSDAAAPRQLPGWNANPQWGATAKTWQADAKQNWNNTTNKWQQKADTWKATQSQRAEQRQERFNSWKQGGTNSWTAPKSFSQNNGNGNGATSNSGFGQRFGGGGAAPSAGGGAPATSGAGSSSSTGPTG